MEITSIVVTVVAIIVQLRTSIPRNGRIQELRVKTVKDASRSRSANIEMILCLAILVLLGVELFKDSPISRLFVIKVAMLAGAFYFLMVHATLMKILDRSVGR
jgi:hypothetical protein